MDFYQTLSNIDVQTIKWVKHRKLIEYGIYIDIYSYMFKYMGVNESANYFKLCQTISYHLQQW